MKNIFTKASALFSYSALVLTFTGVNAYADHVHTLEVDPVVNKIFAELTSDINVQFDEQKFADAYANYCPYNDYIQSQIDYFLIKNQKDGTNVSNLISYISFNSEPYIAGDKRVSFPLDDQYNYFFTVEPSGLYHHIVNGSYPYAPLYNLSKEKNGKPNGTMLMVLPVGSDDHYLGVDTPIYQNDCKTDNTCNDLNQIEHFKPYRTMLMIQRAEDGYCSIYNFKSSRFDIQNLQNSLILQSQINLFAPHGNFRFDITKKNWQSLNKKIKGYFTYELNKLTIDGVEYKMIPGGKVFGTSIWYLKGKGDLHEKWLYMYPIADEEKLYCNDKSCKEADKVIVTVFNGLVGANEYETIKRFVLYPNDK